MADPKRRKNLGRGLSALLGQEDEAAEQKGQSEAPSKSGGGRPERAGPHLVSIDHLHRSAFQPRQLFSADALKELAQSIREKGIIQPIVVRPHPERKGEFEIVAGERRWRAAQLAKLHEVPVVVRELSDTDMLEVALVENLQREDLSPMDEALGYRRLMVDFSYTQDQASQVVGKSRSHVANMLRLLALPDSVRNLLATNQLSAGHGRALVGLNNAEQLAKDIIRKGLSVREAENLARRHTQEGEAGGKSATASSKKDPNTAALEKELSDHLGLSVLINDKRGKGRLTIQYATLEQLDAVLEKLRK